MKTNAIIRIIVWSLVLVVLAGVLGAFLLLDQYRFFRHTERYDSQETIDPATVQSGNAQSFSADKIRQVEILWAAGDITILAKDDITDIRIQEDAVSDSRYQMQTALYGNKLQLQYCGETPVVFGINKDVPIHKNLVIEVPAGWICEELQVEMAASDMDIRNLTIREVDIDGASGTCDFVDCHVTDLDIDTASGDVHFSGTLDVLDFDAASASFVAEFQNTPEKIDMDSMSGSLDIALPEDCGYALSMDGMSSRLSSEFQGTEIRNGTHYYGDGRCRIQVDGMSCDVTIRKNDTVKNTF